MDTEYMFLIFFKESPNKLYLMDLSMPFCHTNTLLEKNLKSISLLRLLSCKYLLIHFENKIVCKRILSVITRLMLSLDVPLSLNISSQIKGSYPLLE